MKNTTTTTPRRKLTHRQKYFKSLRRRWLALEKTTGSFTFNIAHETLPRKTFGCAGLDLAPERTAKNFSGCFHTNVKAVPIGSIFRMKYGHQFVVTSIIHDPLRENRDGYFYYFCNAERIKGQPEPCDTKGDFEIVEEFKNEHTSEGEYRSFDRQCPRPNCPKLDLPDLSLEMFTLTTVESNFSGGVSRIFVGCYADFPFDEGTIFRIFDSPFLVADSIFVERPGRDSYLCIEGLPMW